MTTRRAVGEWNVALVGAATLQGKEVKAVLEERGFPRRRLALIDAEEAQGQLTDLDGEPAVVQPLDPETFHDFDLAIFASAPSFTRQHWRNALENGCRIIDLSGASQDQAGAAICCPFLDPVWGESPSEWNPPQRPAAVPGEIVISPDPASMAIAGILALLSGPAQVLRAAATVHEPVSGHGREGVEELHRQTISLLSFQDPPKAVFDVQVAFNMLSRYGEQSRPTLQQGKQRIVRHLEALLSGRPKRAIVQPAVQLLQAPVFHGSSLSCWVELDHPLTETEVEAALDQKPYSVQREADPQPDLLSAAGQDGFTVGTVERDTSSQAGYWIWSTFDHLRVGAVNAVLVAEQMLRGAGETAAPRKPAPVQPDAV